MSIYHVCTAENQRYRARVRRPGVREYTLVGWDRQTLSAALMDLCYAFDPKLYQRGDVILTADCYDPVPVVEVIRK